MAQPEKIVDLNKNLSDLNTMRSVGGKKQTIGLRDDVVSNFLGKNENLKIAIQQAYDLFKNIQDDNSAFLDLDESDQVKMVQNGITEFIEVGPGKVLNGLNRRINKEIITYNIDKMEHLDACTML